MQATGPGNRLKTLDGWRAVAILAVIFSHDELHRGTGWLYNYGAIGVDVFFAISGILICSRLLDEERTSGTISLSSFYIRRAFRILPPACVYLFTVGLLGIFGLIPVSWRDIVTSLLFVRNYPTIFGVTRGYTGHFWSLALEEQFYWIFPLLLVLSPRRWRWIILLTASALVAVRRAFVLHTQLWEHVQYHTDVRLDSLLAPALFAMLASSSKGKDILRHFLEPWPLYAAALAAALPFGYDTAWLDTLTVWLMPCIVLGSVLHPENLFGRILELPWLKAIGYISYSLYLWQQLFFVAHRGQARPLGILQSWPLCGIATLALATASYWLIEKPSIAFGRRLLAQRHRNEAVHPATA